MLILSGSSAAWLAYLIWSEGVVGSNPTFQTILKDYIMITRLTESGDWYTGSKEAWEVYDLVVTSGNTTLLRSIEEGMVLKDFFYDQA